VENWGRSGNVAENKGTYAEKAGILLKIQDLVLWAGAGGWINLCGTTGRFQTEIPPLPPCFARGQGRNDMVHGPFQAWRLGLEEP